MLQKPGPNNNKLTWLVLACWLFSSCSPLTPTRAPGIPTNAPESAAWDGKPGGYGSLAFVDRFVEGAGPAIFLSSPDRRSQTSWRIQVLLKVRLVVLILVPLKDTLHKQE